MLSAEGSVKVYRGRRVVNDVACGCAQGEIVGLLGPNGAGKTTTFYMIVGLIPPHAGSIRLDDEDITRMPMYQRARRRHRVPGAGAVHLPEADRGRERPRDPRDPAAVAGRSAEARLEVLLDELGIKHLRKSKAYSLSGGERRRLEITRALVTAARVHAAGRAVRRGRPDRGARHPGDRRQPARTGASAS